MKNKYNLYKKNTKKNIKYNKNSYLCNIIAKFLMIRYKSQ